MPPIKAIGSQTLLSFSGWSSPKERPSDSAVRTSLVDGL
jgi:hypothetical protein